MSETLLSMMAYFHFRKGFLMRGLEVEFKPSLNFFKIIGDLFNVCVVFLQIVFVAFIRHIKGLRT